ncbi:hypothetical protein ACFV0R_18195 [Streptomyces sp. NPDC059578]|uniref:hypothetical protein n=1 Tax=Streptomyces sp. NPDC059578 TaxID=3346874 RepID=UPI00367A6C47
MRPMRAVVRATGAAALCAALAAGCSSGGEPEEGGPGGQQTPGARTGQEDTTRGGTAATPTPAPSRLDFEVDPARAPDDHAGAAALAKTAAALPEEFGRGFEKAAPYESSPRDWNVLDESCVWQRGTLPADVLASFTRRSRLPAAGGKGLVRMSSTVTVHRTGSSADWEMAGTLEEALRCPDQRLGGAERVTGLMSLGSAYGEGGNLTADDALMEAGKFVDERIGGKAAYYAWHQARLGPVTLAVVVKGGKGFTDRQLNRSAAEALTFMKKRVREALGAAT